ncbi:tRNA 2'-phosphotransferase [Plectosphaerella plurivora]|uniref:2'-phosphotransferase n=1 Tax=Plectosphaerella plurivora TaxID=936078 RepID=A0A9P9AAB9_9PEZI|nr:tRNA 2'-phosphotransferase [Plectosphaerella plurivora]
MDRNVLISKGLSKLLRHQADSAGVKLDVGGWAELDKVLAYGPIRSTKATLEDIRAVIANSDKTRFALKPNPSTNPAGDETSTDPAHFLIRANQGHSIKVESAELLQPITLEAGNFPPIAVHGTYLATWPAIEASGGLRKMNRNHVHFAQALPGEIQREVSGMRRDAEVLVYVDVEAALRDGAMTWWLSDNGVVLTEGDKEGLVASKYFKEVVVKVADVGTIWKDGEKVAEVPAGVQGKHVPSGRGRGGRVRGRGGRGQ